MMKLTAIFLLAIAHCETRGEKKPDLAVGGDHRSVGRYQITQIYLADANRFMGTNYNILDMTYPDKAESVMLAYLTHYVRQAEEKRGYELEDWEVALIHHHGPNGWKRGANDHYAISFNEYMAKDGK